MATLLDALSDGSFDMQNKRDFSSNFAKELTTYRDLVVRDYTKNGINLNKSIANLAKSKAFNDDQILRVVEEVNNQVYLIEYSKVKENPERHVTFDIASLPKVKAILDGKNNEGEDKPSVKEASVSLGSFEKIASDESEVGDTLSFFQHNGTNRIILKTEVVDSDRNIHLRKIATTILEEKDSLSKTAKVLDSNLNVLAEAFIEYSKLGVDTKSVFADMSKMANLDEDEQSLIKTAIEHNIEKIKETSVVRDGFSVDVEICKVANEEDEFSLGKYSLRKTASQSNQQLPTVVTSKKAIRSINNLVDLANQVSNSTGEYKTKKQKIDKAVKKVAELNIDEASLEKIARGYFNDLSFETIALEKKANNASELVANASKMVDEMLSKGKKEKVMPKINPIKTLNGSPDKEASDNSFVSNAFNKATRKNRWM